MKNENIDGFHGLERRLPFLQHKLFYSFIQGSEQSYTLSKFEVDLLSNNLYFNLFKKHIFLNSRGFISVSNFKEKFTTKTTFYFMEFSNDVEIFAKQLKSIKNWRSLFTKISIHGQMKRLDSKNTEYFYWFKGCDGSFIHAFDYCNLDKLELQSLRFYDAYWYPKLYWKEMTQARTFWFLKKFQRAKENIPYFASKMYMFWRYKPMDYYEEFIKHVVFSLQLKFTNHFKIEFEKKEFFKVHGTFMQKTLPAQIVKHVNLIQALEIITRVKFTGYGYSYICYAPVIFCNYGFIY